MLRLIDIFDEFAVWEIQNKRVDMWHDFRRVVYISFQQIARIEVGNSFAVYI